MTSRPQLLRAKHLDGKLLADYRYHPLIIHRWFGDVEDGLLDAVYAIRDTYALDGSSGHKQVWIHDITELKTLKATARKHLADINSNDPRIAELDNYVIMPVGMNRLIRGAMTAVVWMVGKEKFPIEFQESIPVGIDRALELFEKWGVPEPPIPSNYRFPLEHEATYVDFRKF